MQLISSNESSSINQIHVKLKPFLGVAPKYYLAIFYGLIFLGILFYLTFWEGLTHPGTLVKIDSKPQGASVHFQGKLYGHTPLTAFFPQGHGELKLSKPSFDDLVISYQSESHLFFSGFFPRRDQISVQLPFSSQEDLELRTVLEMGKWSVTSFSDRYPAPPLFTEFIQNAQAQNWDLARQKQFLLAQRRYVSDPFLYSDFGRACGLWHSKPPEDLQKQYDLWKAFLQDEQSSQEQLIVWVFANQPKAIRSNLLNHPTAFFREALTAWQESSMLENVALKKESPSVNKTIMIEDHHFIFVQGGIFRWGLSNEPFSLPLDPPFQIPVVHEVESFWLSRSETTQAQFARFIDANPSWAPSRRSDLIVRGLAEENYLIDWKKDRPPSPSSSVTGISWYAALAYTQWLNSKLKGKKATLPCEAEWEWAALKDKEGKPDNALFSQKGKVHRFLAMSNGVWEWTQSSYAPGDYLVLTNILQEYKQSSYYRTTKGGCDENKGKVNIWDRGVAKASSGNPYLGFRVALKKNP